MDQQQLQQGSVYGIDQGGFGNTYETEMALLQQQQVVNANNAANGNGMGVTEPAQNAWNLDKSYHSLVELGQQQFGQIGGNSTVGGGTKPPPIQMVDPTYGEDDVSSFEGSYYGTYSNSKASVGRSKQTSSTGRRSKNSSRGKKSSKLDPGGRNTNDRRAPERSRSSSSMRQRGSNSRRIDHTGNYSDHRPKSRGSGMSRERSKRSKSRDDRYRP